MRNRLCRGLGTEFSLYMGEVVGGWVIEFRMSTGCVIKFSFVSEAG